MAKFNVNSNAYIIIYSVVMVVVVAVLLSVTSLSLQSRQNENMLNEKRQQIVKALGENPETAAYGDVVAEAAMLDKSGNKIEGTPISESAFRTSSPNESNPVMPMNALRPPSLATAPAQFAGAPPGFSS